jgi:hypothetical protein
MNGVLEYFSKIKIGHNSVNNTRCQQVETLFKKLFYIVGVYFVVIFEHLDNYVAEIYYVVADMRGVDICRLFNKDASLFDPNFFTFSAVN